jgi:hypothetical protein
MYSIAAGWRYGVHSIEIEEVKIEEAMGMRRTEGIDDEKNPARTDRRIVLHSWAAITRSKELSYSLPLAWRTTCIMTSCRLVPAAFVGSMLRTRAVRTSKRS